MTAVAQLMTHRTASAQHWRFLWPVVDTSQSLRELAEDARADLPGLLRQRHLTAVGRPRFSRRPGCDVPGSGGVDEVFVADVLTLPAEHKEADQ